MLLFALIVMARVTLAQAPQPAESAADAQTDDASSEPREQTLRAALAAYERSDLELARTLFEAVHAENPSARTLRGLGIVAYRQGRFADAVALLERSLASDIRPLTAEMQTSVQVLRDDASLRVGRLALVVAPASAQVQVDGQPGVQGLNGEFLLAPGNHTLEASAPHYASTRLVVSTKEAESQRMELELVPMPEPSAALPPVADSALVAKTFGPAQKAPLLTKRPGNARSRRLRHTAYALLGVAGAGLVTASVATALGAHRVNRIEDFCRDQDGGQCERQQVLDKQDRNNLKLLSALSIGGFVLGGVSAAASGTLLLVVSRQRSEDQTQVTRAELRIRGHF
jgi:hypothetical protein